MAAYKPEVTDRVACAKCSKTGKQVICICNFICDIETKREEDVGQLLVKNEMNEKCQIHRNNDVEYFCPDHDQVVCTTCIQISHRACAPLRQIAEASVGISLTPDFQKLKQDLARLEMESEKNVNSVADETKNLNAVYEQTLEEVTQMLKRVYDYDKLNLESIAKTSEVIQHEIDSIKRGLEHGNENHKFLVMKRAETELKKFEESLKSARRDAKIQRYGLLPTTNDNDCNERQSNTVLGQLCHFPVCLKTITIETLSDRHHCSISGLELLEGHRLLVSDNGNKKIKMFSVTNSSLLFELPVETTPMFLVRICPEIVAMSSATERRMYIMSVTEHIDLTSDFEIEGFPRNVGSICGKLIVSYSDEQNTHIIDKTGYVQRTIGNPSENQKERLQKCTNSFSQTNKYSDIFYQTLSGENKVVQMNLDGDVINYFEATDMKYPIDIARGKEGSVYVCCRESDNIFKLSNDLSVGHVILNERHGLVSPWCITLCDEENVLYVGSYGGRHVHMFKL